VARPGCPSCLAGYYGYCAGEFFKDLTSSRSLPDIYSSPLVLNLRSRSIPSECQDHTIRTAVHSTISLRATTNIHLKATASNHHLSIKATPSNRTTPHRAVAIRIKDLRHQPGRTASALLNMVDSRWVFKAISTAPTMRATRKET
jgi:hypothetical protein